MSDTCREYVDDNYCPDGNEAEKSLLMRVEGYDYFIQTVQEGVRAGFDDPKPGEIVKRPIYGPIVRIRTSGSSDPRNTRVCEALRELWDALGGT